MIFSFQLSKNLFFVVVHQQNSPVLFVFERDMLEQLGYDGWHVEGAGGITHADLTYFLGGITHADLTYFLGGITHADLTYFLGGITHADLTYFLGGITHADLTYFLSSLEVLRKQAVVLLECKTPVLWKYKPEKSMNVTLSDRDFLVFANQRNPWVLLGGYSESSSAFWLQSACRPRCKARSPLCVTCTKNGMSAW